MILYIDGIVEARSPEGEYFGEERLTDFVHRASAEGDPAPETLRRLMRRVLARQPTTFRTTPASSLLEWRTGDERRLDV